jgi:hypothetical protein
VAGDFEFENRRHNQYGAERIEVDTAGNCLKKYGATETSWPTHSKVQMHGESHISMMDRVSSREDRI